MKHKEHTGGAGSKDTFLLVPICWSWLKIIHGITGKILDIEDCLLFLSKLVVCRIRGMIKEYSLHK